MPAYVYSSVLELQRSNPTMLVCSLLRQLIASTPKMLNTVRERYYARDTQGRISLRDAISMIAEISNERAVTYILIDALDECWEERGELCEALGTLVQESTGLIKILMSSRHASDLVQSFREYPNIAVGAANPEDLNTFLRELKFKKAICDGEHGV